MKTFFIALLLFSLLLGFIIYNYFEINSISADFIEQTQRLPATDEQDCLAASQKLANDWNSKRDFISFSCGLSKLDTITDLTDRLCFFAETGNSSEFELTRRLLINSFEDIAEFESLRPEDIF